MNDRIHAAIEATDSYQMLSPSRMLNLYHLLSQTLARGVTGDIVEVGCCTGFSARLIRMIMDCFDCDRPFHVYDSFEGLSAPTPGDTGIAHFAFQCGYCTAGFLNESQVLLERLARTPIARTDLDKTIAEALDGHLCRCTGYVKYHEAVRDVILVDSSRYLQSS